METSPRTQHPRTDPARPRGCLDCAVASLDMTNERAGEAELTEHSTPTNQRRLDQSPDRRRGGAEKPSRRRHFRSSPARPGDTPPPKTIAFLRDRGFHAPQDPSASSALHSDHHSRLHPPPSSDMTSLSTNGQSPEEAGPRTDLLSAAPEDPSTRRRSTRDRSPPTRPSSSAARAASSGGTSSPTCCGKATTPSARSTSRRPTSGSRSFRRPTTGPWTCGGRTTATGRSKMPITSTTSPRTWAGWALSRTTRRSAC